MAELGDGSAWGVKLLWSIEGFSTEDALETRGGIVRALPLLGREPFIAVAGDIVTDFDYSTLVRRAGTLSPAGSLAHPAMFEGLPDERAKLFPWMNRWIDRGQVSGELYRGPWANVGTPEELRRAEALFSGEAA